MMLFEVLFDPLISPSLFACTLMGALGALVSLFIVFRKESLVGETLSHASYPGMSLGLIIASLFFSDGAIEGLVFAFLGAALSSFLAYRAISFLTKGKVAKEDSALSALLSSSFAIALLLISLFQKEYPLLSRRIEALLIGQVATIQAPFLYLCIGSFSLGALLLFFFRRSLKTLLFDEEFAHLSSLSNRTIEALFQTLVVLTVILGIRGMGVVLMSALLVFPGVSARLFAKSFSGALFFSIAIGALSGFFGLLLSYLLSLHFHSEFQQPLWVPTGPLIALLMAFLFTTILFFSPREGLLIKYFRKKWFFSRCERENLLKLLWKEAVKLGSERLPLAHIKECSHLSSHRLKKCLKKLERDGLLKRDGDYYIELTSQGMLVGRKLVRLHRLWELYLVECLGMAKERVHPSAEEMEHILTPQKEKELSRLLHDPHFDPHAQPIPSEDETALLQSGGG